MLVITRGSYENFDVAVASHPSVRDFLLMTGDPVFFHGESHGFSYRWAALPKTPVCRDDVWRRII